MGEPKTSYIIQIKIKIPNPSQEPPESSKSPNQDLKEMGVQIKIQMPNPSQEPAMSSKSPSQDLEDMDVLCTFKVKIESWNLEYVSIKD